MPVNKNTRQPRQKRSKNTKRKIINAGETLFAEKGYHGTNSKEIAKKAGVSIGSFYAYFEDKHELMMTIFQEYHGRIKEVLKAITIDDYLKKGDVKGFVEHLIEKLMEAHNVSPKLHQEIEAMKHSDEDIKKMTARVQKDSLEFTRQILPLWKNKLRIKNTDLSSIIINKTIEEIVHEIKFTDQPYPQEVLINELSDMIYRYLAK